MDMSTGYDTIQISGFEKKTTNTDTLWIQRYYVLIYVIYKILQSNQKMERTLEELGIS